MARLNEPPVAPSAAATGPTPPPQPGVESLEAVKRRFVRQNRELAKNNSTQGLRIRGLELDVSRLLQTNQELRAEVVRVRLEVQDAQRQASREGVRRFREEMAAKIRELSGLVEGIEEEEEAKEGAEVREERKRDVLAQFEFRERQPLVEIMRDNAMPVIEETKSFPRTTLDAEEIKAVRLSGSSSAESPDLGPPPVARFDYEDPIKFNAQAAPSPTVEMAETHDEEELPASLSVNLETRRRRKDGQPKLEIRRHSILPPASPSSTPGEPAEVSAPTLRTGAKRKLADRDLEQPVQAPTKTDFTFSRKGISADNGKLEEGQAPIFHRPAEEVEAVASPMKPARKVLGDKSVNQSPRKAAPVLEKEGKEDSKKAAAEKPSAVKKDRAPSRRSRLSGIPTAQPSVPPIVDIHPEPQTEHISTPSEPAQPPSADQKPTTPAPDAIFSPPSSIQQEFRDTPPPTQTQSDTTARPSRRARAAVNYAEPSLAAKMRRPGKAMVDAISGLPETSRRTSGKSAGKGEPVVVKIEDDEDGAGSGWKGLPEAGTRGARASKITPRLAISPWEERSRGRLSAGSGEVKIKIEEGEEDVAIPPPHSQADPPASATDAPKTANSNKPQTQNGGDEDLDAAARKLQELDIYDFKDSSGISTSSSNLPSPVESTGKGAASNKGRNYRRHSTVGKEALPGNEQITGKESSNRAVSGSVGAGSGRSGSRRRSMMV